MSAKDFFELMHGNEENLNKQHIITLMDQFIAHKVLDKKMKAHEINNNVEETRKSTPVS